MRVLVPCDPNQLKFYIDQSLNLNGPTYIRIGKKGEPTITQDKGNKNRKSNLIREGNDFLILAIGPIINEALIAVEKFESDYQKV